MDPFAVVILTLCSVSTTCRDALANFGTEPLGVFSFAITTPGDDEAAASTERPGGGPAGSLGKFGNSTQLGG